MLETGAPNYSIRVNKKAIAFSKGLQMFFLSIIFYIAVLLNFYLLEIPMNSNITLLVATILLILMIIEILLSYLKENTEINFYDSGISKLTNKGENIVPFSKYKSIKLSKTLPDLIFNTAHIKLGRVSFGPISNYKQVYDYAKKLFDYAKSYEQQQNQNKQFYDNQNQQYNSQYNNYNNQYNNQYNN